MKKEDEQQQHTPYNTGISPEQYHEHLSLIVNTLEGRAPSGQDSMTLENAWAAATEYEERRIREQQEFGDETPRQDDISEEDKALQAEQEIREIREAKLERAFNRLAQYEFQEEPATAEQEREVDEALAVIEEIEAHDEDLVNYMGNYVFDQYKEADQSQDDQFDIER